MCKSSCGEHIDSSLQTLGTDTKITVNQIWSQKEQKLFVNLESHLHGEWKTVASYSSDDDAAVRLLNRCNGDYESFVSHLPQKIVQQMAFRDFAKNWKSYVEEFEKLCKNNLHK